MIQPSLTQMPSRTKLENMKTMEFTAPPEQVADMKISDYVVTEESGPDMDYQDALILAMKQEKVAFRLYLDLAEQVDNEDQKALFLSLAQEEAKHKLRFEIEYDDFVLNEN